MNRLLAGWIDELERDLGQAAVLRLLANAGGQRRNIPKRAEGSVLAREVGDEVVSWLAARFGNTSIDIPSRRGRDQQNRANQLRAAILEAGLTNPTRSANVIAKEFDVTAVWVSALRREMREEFGLGRQAGLFPFDDDEA